jgi:hypothetical protein
MVNRTHTEEPQALESRELTPEEHDRSAGGGLIEYSLMYAFVALASLAK